MLCFSSDRWLAGGKRGILRRSKWLDGKASSSDGNQFTPISAIGIKDYEPVPGWQKVYFGSNHLVTRTGALTCINCHAVNGVLNFKALGYSDPEINKLTSPEIYFEKLVKKQKEEW
jgi:hypothetical protein